MPINKITHGLKKGSVYRAMKRYNPGPGEIDTSHD